MVITLFVWLALAWVVTVAAIALLQNRLLYLPERTTVAVAESPGLAAWPSRGDFRGLAAEPAGAAIATAIVFHGNAGHAGQREYYRWALADLGVRVILAEYPGYGPRSGRLGERSLVADAADTVALARRMYAGPLLLVGESLGAGVATAIAVRQRALLAGLMLLTPWDRLASVAAHHYPWLPVRLLLRDRYDNRGNLVGVERPVLVIVAANDAIVPARFGLALHAALDGPKRLEVIAGAGHNDWREHAGADFWPRALEFLLQGAGVR